MFHLFDGAADHLEGVIGHQLGDLLPQPINRQRFSCFLITGSFCPVRRFGPSGFHASKTLQKANGAPFAARLLKIFPIYFQNIKPRGVNET